MGQFFHVAFYQPIFNGLIGFVQALPGHDLGLAIILVTIVIRLILLWPSVAQIRSSRSMQIIGPKLKALQKEFAGDRQELAKRTMQLYREHKVNPLSSCLPLLIQLPFLFALYQVFIAGLKVDSTTHLLNPDQLKDLYGPLRAVFQTTPIDTVSFGLNLAVGGSIILALLVAGTQFYQAKMLTPTNKTPKVPGAQDEQMATAISRQMMYIMPLFIGYLSYKLPSGLGLYFLISNIFSIGQQWLILRRDNRPKTEPEAAKP